MAGCCLRLWRRVPAESWGWNWTKSEPLVFGVLPIGLAYHAGYSLLAAVTMAVLVKFAWPKHLESVQPEDGTHKRPEEEA